MSAIIVPIPPTVWRRYGHARQAVLLRASAIGATDAARGHALHVLLDSLQSGASAACAIGQANGYLRRATAGVRQAPQGGAA